jgi:glutamate decarboxylase
LLGIGENGLVLIDTDEDYRMRIDLLTTTIDELVKKKVLILAIVGIAGTTETGSIDPLVQIGALANKYCIHFHVDGAWGGPLILSQEHGYKLNGIEFADSITIDGHKQFYTPMGLGIVLFKSPNSIQYIKKTANYVIRSDSMDTGKFTLEGSRPANILFLHASLSLLGRDGLSNILTRTCTLVKQMYTRLSEHPSGAFQVLHEPQMNLLLYRYIPSWLRHLKGNYTTQENELMNEIVKMMHKKQSSNFDGKAHTFTSRTNVEYCKNRTECFRIVIANPLTEWNHIQECIDYQLKIGARCELELKFKETEKEILQKFPIEIQNDKNPFWISWPMDI